LAFRQLGLLRLLVNKKLLVNRKASRQPKRKARMSMQIDTRLGEQIGRYLDLTTSQIKLTAANMANIDTPGYRAVGMDFEAEIEQAMASVDYNLPPRPPRLRDVDGLISRPDGNNVSMDREGLTLAEAQLKFKIGVALLRGENQAVMDAIHADK
jgi:flagellar basal-body rod protein FlgB